MFPAQFRNTHAIAALSALESVVWCAHRTTEWNYEVTNEQTHTECGIGAEAGCVCGAPASATGAAAGSGFSLAALSRNERIALLAAIVVVVAGITAAALSPGRVDTASAATLSVTHESCPTPTATAAPLPATASSTTTAPAAITTGTVTATVTATATTRRAVATRRPVPARPTAPANAPPVVAGPTTRGLVVTFGTYDGAPLRWRVLADSGDELVLLSANVLTAGAFRSEWETENANRYATSEVRGWLVNQFAPTAFSAEESAALLPHVGGAVGPDRIFLLSAAEVSRYLPEAASRKATPRAGAATKVGYSGSPLALTGSYAGWWLADAAGSGSSARVVGADGVLGSQPVYYADLGVRPAIRVDRTKVALSLSGSGGN